MAQKLKLSTRRRLGTVKWFVDEKGYGFILPADAEHDVFVHWRQVVGEGYRSLSQGEQVSFIMAQGPKGPVATEVVRVPTQFPSDALHGVLALGLFDRQLRVVELAADGTYAFVQQDRPPVGIYYLNRAALALDESIEELEDLINVAVPSERVLQSFFERHPEFITADEYQRAHPHVMLCNGDAQPLIPDFFLEPRDGALSDLLELKLPTSKIVVTQKGRHRFSSGVVEACAQLRTYGSFFDEPRNREHIYSRYGLRAYKPRLYVIIGRRGNIDPITLRAIEGDLPQLHLRTYDDVVDRMKRRAEALRQF